jgi:hypothetical protein
VTWQEYLATVQEAVRAHPEWRVGQTYSNVLAVARPDLKTNVDGTVIDPFYLDTRVSAFVSTVRELW